MEDKDYYIRLEINKNHTTFHYLVWCGKDRGWISIDDAYESMFRTVHTFSSKDAYRLKEEMENSGFFYPAFFKSGTLDISVKDYWYRNTFILFDWDEDEGVTEPLVAIRCDGHYDAVKYFQEHHSDKLTYPEGQVWHISKCKYKKAYKEQIEKLTQEANLFDVC